MKEKIALRNIAAMAAALLCASTTHSYAQDGLTEFWGSVYDTALTLADQATGVPQGCLIEIGTVTNVTAIQAAATVSGSAVQALFTTFATGLVGDGVGLDGLFARTDRAIAGTDILGKQVYILAFDAATAAAATQIGLFYVPTNYVPGWAFPSDNWGAGIVDLSDNDGLGNGLVALIGSIGTGTVVTPTDIEGWNAAALQTIPEPSTLALVGAGLLGAIGLIRHRRS